MLQRRINNRCECPETEMSLTYFKGEQKAGVARTVNKELWMKKRSEVGRVTLGGFLLAITESHWNVFSRG